MGEEVPLRDRSRDYDDLVDRFDDDIGPGREEIEAWAARERRLRKEWLEGPSERDRVMWARRERMRRLDRFGGSTRARSAPPERSELLRDCQLAAEGAAVEFFAFPFRFLDYLIDSGRRVERSSARRRGGDPDDLD